MSAEAPEWPKGRGDIPDGKGTFIFNVYMYLSLTGAAIGKIIGVAWPYFTLHWTMNFIIRGVSRISRVFNLILTRYFFKREYDGGTGTCLPEFRKNWNIDPRNRANFALSGWGLGKFWKIGLKIVNFRALFCHKNLKRLFVNLESY